MSIEITDPEVERVVRELALRLNVEPAEAVRLASEAALAHGTLAEVDEVEIEAILRRLHDLPVVDARTPDEILAEVMDDGPSHGH
jgi:hypothetical protein